MAKLFNVLRSIKGSGDNWSIPCLGVKAKHFGLAIFLLFSVASMGRAEAVNPWVISCPGETCTMRASVQSDAGVAFTALIYSVDQNPVIEVLTPLGIYLQHGVKLLVDEKTVFPTKMLSCELDGCRAFSRLSPSLLSSLKQGLKMQIVVVTARTRETLAFEVSLVGFTKTYEDFVARESSADQ